MLLAIDIGNTNIAFGVFKGSKIIKRFLVPTKNYNIFSLKRKLNKLFIDDVIVSSVVPHSCRVLEKDLKTLFSRKPYILGKNITVPIKNLYRKPRQVGQDRLVNAYAGIQLFGAPLIVVDFGTAITFDVVSRKEEYLGGLILPGLSISLEALSQKTALLPKIKLAQPTELIGQDTQNSMLSGIIYGFAALTDELVQKIKKKIGDSAKVIGTGGNINLIAQYCKSFDKIDSDLTLKGLYMIYNDILNNK
jgi:type III pantothenate kinase